MQRLAFRKIFNQFSHISYLLVISFTTKFELQKSNYFCGFNINASKKKIILSLSLSLSLSRLVSSLSESSLHSRCCRTRLKVLHLKSFIIVNSCTFISNYCTKYSVLCPIELTVAAVYFDRVVKSVVSRIP